MDIEALCRMAIDDVDMCALDFETTQVQGITGALAITEVAAQRFRGGQCTAPEFHALVDPKCPIRPFDTRVSGITDAMVKGKPTFGAIREGFFSYIGGHILVAHNAASDRRALESQCARDGCEVPTIIMLDTAALARKLLSLSSYNLDSVCRHFGVKQGQAHRASGDCQAARGVFAAASQALPTPHGIRTFGKLCQFLGLKLVSSSVQRSLFGPM
jgi:DNA polymerase III epsilon subunit family exonuclease